MQLFKLYNCHFRTSVDKRLAIIPGNDTLFDIDIIAILMLVYIYIYIYKGHSIDKGYSFRSQINFPLRIYSHIYSVLLAFSPRLSSSQILILYRNTEVKVHSPDGDTDIFDFVSEVLQGNALSPFLFLI